MKKYFFFCMLFIPLFVKAGSIKELEVLNGTLSRPFDSNNNIYSVVLDEASMQLDFRYTLEDAEAMVQVTGNNYEVGQDNVATIFITNSDGTKESYTFYYTKEQTTPVFNENTFIEEDPVQEIEHLEIYVGLGCFLFVALFFKIFILGFKKRSKCSKLK